MDRPVLYMMVGLPGSGKTTAAHAMAAEKGNSEVISSDAIREEIWGDEGCQKDAKLIFSIMRQRTIDALSAGKNVYYDATNLAPQNRAFIIDSVGELCDIEAYVLNIGIDECIERMKQRKRKIPRAVVERLAKRFSYPSEEEGFNKITYIY